MTVVAAIARYGSIVIATDRETTYGQTPLHGAVKVVRLPVRGGDTPEEALLAFAGDGAMPALARRRLSLTVPREGETLHHWADEVAVSFTEAAHTMGPSLIESANPQDRLPGAALLGFRGQLFYLFTHQAVPVVEHAGEIVAALGSGSELALGVMHLALTHDTPPRQAAERAVLLACQFCAGCGLGDQEPHVEILSDPSFVD